MNDRDIFQLLNRLKRASNYSIALTGADLCLDIFPRNLYLTCILLREGAHVETTRLSSKGQVIIPKTIRESRHWSPGLELQIIDAEDGVLLKPMAPFEESLLQDVAGCLKRDREAPMSKDEVTAAVRKGVREAWRGRS